MTQSNETTRIEQHTYTVGLHGTNVAGQIIVEAEDALIAALKAKQVNPEATITYVRRTNRRGDLRHPHPHIA